MPDEERYISKEAAELSRILAEQLEVEQDETKEEEGQEETKQSRDEDALRVNNMSLQTLELLIEFSEHNAKHKDELEFPKVI